MQPAHERLPALAPRPVPRRRIRCGRRRRRRRARALLGLRLAVAVAPAYLSLLNLGPVNRTVRRRQRTTSSPAMVRSTSARFFWDRCFRFRWASTSDSARRRLRSSRRAAAASGDGSSVHFVGCRGVFVKETRGPRRTRRGSASSSAAASARRRQPRSWPCAARTWATGGRPWASVSRLTYSPWAGGRASAARRPFGEWRVVTGPRARRPGPRRRPRGRRRGPAPFLPPLVPFSHSRCRAAAVFDHSAATASCAPRRPSPRAPRSRPTPNTRRSPRRARARASSTRTSDRRPRSTKRRRPASYFVPRPAGPRPSARRVFQ